MTTEATPDHSPAAFDRRVFLKRSMLAAGAVAAGHAPLGPPSLRAQATAATPASAAGQMLTRFLHACMTLPYRNHPLERALQGIKSAGYEHVAWGTTHREADGQNRPVIAPDAPPARAADLGRRCRDLGLSPALMFALVYPDLPDALSALTHRIKQAAAAGIPQLLIFGDTKGGDPRVWIERFKVLGPIAAEHGVLLVMKQHGGETTGTGQALAKIVEAVAHPQVKMSYDAGNVLWYLDVDPLPDIRTCSSLIHAFSIKDCRIWPRKTTCGPGYGDIDHYRLFEPVAFTGRTITLAYENLTPSYLPLGTTPPESIDRWARLAREYVENVIQGLQTVRTATS